MVIAGIIVLNSPLLVGVSFLLVLVTALAMGLPWRYVLARLLLLVPFLLFMSVPLVVGGGWPPAPAYYNFALLLVLKVLTSAKVKYWLRVRSAYYEKKIMQEAFLVSCVMFAFSSSAYAHRMFTEPVEPGVVRVMYDGNRPSIIAEVVVYDEEERELAQGNRIRIFFQFL